MLSFEAHYNLSHRRADTGSVKRGAGYLSQTDISANDAQAGQILTNLQGLRAFAAINVVYFHTLVISPQFGWAPQMASVFSGWGANGVDIFFVISGFIMFHTQYNDKRSVRSFLISRVIRIVPLYWLVTTVSVLTFAENAGEVVPLDEWVVRAVLSYGFISQFVLDLPPIVRVGWTLEFEMLFYLVFGLALVFARWSIILSVVVACLIGLIVLTGNFLLAEFLLGIGVGFLFNRLTIDPKIGLVILCLGFGLLCLSIGQPIGDLGFDRFLIWGVPSALIVYGAATTWQTGSGLVRYLGDASYSIYLVQMLVVIFMFSAPQVIALGWNADFMGLVVCLVVVIYGCIIHSYIEKPMIRALRNRIKSSKREA